jgi:hypothetical protein
MHEPPTITVYRPIGPEEYELVRKNGFTAWPPRKPDQTIFYPVANEEYAVEITRCWNVKQYGVGYVTRFEISRSFMDRYELQTVGAAHHREWWVPARDLAALNQHIVGKIEVIGKYTE